jgi:hypothetical protein
MNSKKQMPMRLQKYVLNKTQVVNQQPVVNPLINFRTRSNTNETQVLKTKRMSRLKTANSKPNEAPITNSKPNEASIICLKKRKVSTKLHAVFYNSPKAICSIYSSGIMCYDVLKKSTLYDLHYTEDIGKIDYDADFLIFNHHPWVCNWMTSSLLDNYPGTTFCIVTEIGLYSDDPAPLTPKIFDHYIVLDPTIPEKDKFYAFPRPLISCHVPKYIENDVPIIGSFGFAHPGKNFAKIIEYVCQEFESAIIRFNIPKSTFVPENIENMVMNEIELGKKVLIDKPKIVFELTSNVFETQQEIVNWCSQNTINIFLYNRSNQESGNLTGLSAVVDQAIISGRPLLVSSDLTFRHIHPYIPHFPTINIKTAIETTLDGVLRMKKNWSAQNFLIKFENLIHKQKVLFLNHKKQQCGVYQYGKRVCDILKKCDYICYEYREVETVEEYNAVMKEEIYHAVIFNYNAATMPWLNASSIHTTQENIGICHESSSGCFDKYINIDPQFQESLHNYTIPRPIFEDIPNCQLKGPFGEFVSYTEPETPIFGSFGFGFHFKGFHNIVKMINDQYDKAIIKFVISHAVFDGNSDTIQKACNECHQHNTKKDIVLMIHTEFVSEEELLMFLQSNTMNIFLYDLLHGRGISSAIDYALSIDKPLGISDSFMFRNIYHDDICLFKNSIDECMRNSLQYCSQFRSLYSHHNMIEKFKEILMSP